ncbi:hypothetical protein C8R44DRAFT_836696 [Mycena epipterygia]|nr:hypothetical protein C8R44DRAFT_836696 [Mycena epipterygia]
MLPLYIGSFSAVALCLHILWESALGLKLRASYSKVIPSEHANVPETHAQESSIAEHIAKHGGNTIFAFKTTRLIGCIVLLGLSSATLAFGDEEGLGSTPHRYLQSAMCVVYFYAAVLAIFSVSTSVKWSKVVVKHLNALLLSTFCVYFYRDIFPLATFPLTPMDLWEGRLLWPKVITLFAVSGIIPLVIPRQYTPLNPKNPMPLANPEQTASILSSTLYFFVDPIVALASRVPHLGFDQLPPLCDYDYAEDLKVKSFPYLDSFASGKKQHIMFGLFQIFRWEFLTMGILLTIAGLSSFISPLAINRLLNYLEDPGSEPFMKPWFWIFLLLLGPMTYALAFQWDLFIGTHIMAQTTAIVTELVFEHALRIRFKAETAEKSESATKSSSEKASANLLGKINTLVTVDLSKINEMRNVLFLFVLIPIQLVGCVVFLYQVLGWSAFVGMALLAALSPLPGYLAKLQSNVQKEALNKTDARVQTVSEMVNVIRMIKMFGWEKQMEDKIAEKREEELTWIWWRKVLYTTNDTVKYTIVMKEELTASKVFSSMAVFDLLRAQIWFTVFSVSLTVNGKVSLDRVNDFLHNTELLDSFISEDTPGIVVHDSPASDLIGFRDAMFTWVKDDKTNGALTPSSRRFLLKIEGELLFKPGCINLIVGPTGSGKTSLLMALLGEMHLIRSSPSSWLNLPRGIGVSYAAQESWVMNDTIKNNIIFNAPFDQDRFNKVLYQCCLERDLELFDAGSETEVGEKGLTLSGGQKARVTLARAIYSDSQIVLLDDVFAALDVHTAKWVVDKCLGGDLIKNRTVILVTHNVALASKMATFVVSVGLDGCVRSQGSISDAIVKDELLVAEVIKDQAMLEKVENQNLNTEEPKQTDGKLIVAEEIEIGRVSWNALNMFFFGMGGDHTVAFFIALVFFLVLNSLAGRLGTWYLGYWARYLGGFAGFVLADTMLYTISYVYFTLGSFRASKSIHKELIESVFGTTFRYGVPNLSSRIIARITGDTDIVDDALADGFWDLISATFQMLTKFLAIIIYTPVFFVPGALVGVIGAWCGRVYMKSQLSVQRELSNVKAPVLGHIGATMAGLASVRAYGAQEALIQISMQRINRLTRASRTFANLNRWVIVRIDILGALFATLLAYYLVYFQNQRSSNIGFVLHMALAFCNDILDWVRFATQFEVQSNRKQEPKATSSGIPPAYWPASGELTVENLSAKYSPDGPKVLHDISFNIKSGERVGVVGRTGSGKSSLTLALLRCIFTDGAVYYDGIPTSSLNLDALRANVTIIPQMPELLAGSLRSNLDLLAQSDDATLNDALRAAGLSALQEEMEDGKITLDTEISAGGSNLSVGQRQIIALARAIVLGSKLLILDEDYKTDAVIQSSLRTELTSDTTLLIVAHRLQTVMDADKIVEFDSPKALLKNKHGMLRALVDESGDKGMLYGMAED